ncbi:hypothetical protein NLX83_23390 [Allokutzneria sp. A3M-2-11 16]|uniref:hypothetical protein n=1 Tax=Allokutzneria sp. A3M-2-11 16 TaxID=2962043 RepID=UPI0020B864C1|nr:hypothetical protein [Allokutzneria sp. A3M-2-11 16]MCP3802217.1 hypothetical protein [Allokutzneria sp. A3M-2-11 16]
MMDIEVRTRVPDVPAVLVRLADDRTTARELISRAVEEQIRELRADTGRCRRALDRQYLSDEDLRAQAAAGVIKMPRPAPPEPGIAEEVARAHRAFARGTFVIFVGGHQVHGLDEEVVVRLGEPVVFLRLVALAGG